MPRGGFSDITWFRPQSWSLAACVAAIARTALAERERWALWVPVLFGVGIATNFALPFDLPLSESLIVASGLTGITWAAHFLGAARLALILIVPTVLSAGLAMASFRSEFVEAPVLQRALVIVGLTGRVVKVEAFANGPRIRLENLLSPRGWRGEKRPYSVRVKLQSGDVPQIGSRIRLTARLSPPPAPSYPGAYDFARAAWFQKLGAVGYAMSKWETVPRITELGFVDRFQAALSQFRYYLSHQIQKALPGTSGAIAAALLTGDRAAVPEAVLEDLRVSGLAHLLAISGLHIGMISVIVFVSFRVLLASRESWARDRPIKKWAAIAAFIASFGYLLLSGATVPTQRAFLMTGIVLIAVMTDRQAISMRLVAVAAMVVLLIAPEGIVGASFQLSFAAVVALVAVYEGYRPGFGLGDKEGWKNDGWGYRILFYLAAVALTTLVAGTATAPFAIYHFGRVAHYSILANLLAIPLVTFIVMPMGLLSLLLMPVGLPAIPLGIAGWAIDQVLAIAHFTAFLPGSVSMVPPLTGWGMACVALGGLWCAIWRHSWRFLGLPLVLAGILSPLAQPTPLVMLHPSGTQAAIAWQGELWVEASRRERFSLSVWEEKTALAIAGTWRDLAEKSGSPLNCDPLGCVFRMTAISGGEISIAFAADPRAIPEDCRRSDASRLPAEPHPALCRARPAFGPADLRRGGTHVLYATSDRDERLRVDTVEAHRGDRYWTR